MGEHEVDPRALEPIEEPRPGRTSSNLGFVLGPALAGALGATALQETLPVLAALFISVVASSIIAFKLPDTNICTLATDPERTNVRKVLGQEQKECFQLEAASKLSMREVLTLPGVAALLTLHFLVFLAFNLFYISFPIYASTGMGWTLTDLGVFGKHHGAAGRRAVVRVHRREHVLHIRGGDGTGIYYRPRDAPAGPDAHGEHLGLRTDFPSRSSCRTAFRPAPSRNRW